MSVIDRSQAPGPGPIRLFHIPEITRAELPNGLKILVAPQHVLPVVTVDVVLDAGAAAEPAVRAGLARLTARTLETGTFRRSAVDLAWELEYQGIELAVETGFDASLVRMTVPRERLEPALALLAEVLLEPSFPAAEVERIRDEQLAEIMQRSKDPRALATDRAAGFIYAADSPYARPAIGTAETVARIDRSDVETFYRSRYRPAGTALVIAGDVDAETALKLSAGKFAPWAGGAPETVEFGTSRATDNVQIHVIDRPGSVQSELRIGHVGVARSHPDHFPLLVLNEILGGAFTSRLNLNLREKHGFTYGVGSSFAFRRRPGPFMIQTAVATEMTARAIEEIIKEVMQLRIEGPTEEETGAARDFLTGVLPLQWQTTDQIAARLADLVVYDLPDDYFQHFQDGIAAVRAEDVTRVGLAHLHPDRFAIVIAGNADAIAEPLRALNIGALDIHHADEER